MPSACRERSAWISAERSLPFPLRLETIAFKEINLSTHGDGICFEMNMAMQESNHAPEVPAFRTDAGNQGRSNGTSCPNKHPSVAGMRSATLAIRPSRNAVLCGRTRGFARAPCTASKKHPAQAGNMWECGPRSRVGLCPSRLEAIRPSLAKRGTAPQAGASHEAVLRGRTRGFVHTPRTANKKRPARGRFLFGGEGGIRTHVPGLPDHLISSQRRYGHFGTSPELRYRRS